MLTTAFTNAIHLSFAYCFSLSINYCECDHCAAAYEEEFDSQCNIAVIAGLRSVGIGYRFIQLIESCLCILDFL